MSTNNFTWFPPSLITNIQVWWPVLRFFKKRFWRRSVLFVGPLIPLFCTSGNVSPGFQSQGGSPFLYALLPICNRILRFTSGVTPVDLLVASMTVELFQSIYLQTSIGEAWVWDLLCCCLTAWDQTDALPTELYQLGWLVFRSVSPYN